MFCAKVARAAGAHDDNTLYRRAIGCHDRKLRRQGALVHLGERLSRRYPVCFMNGLRYCARRGSLDNQASVAFQHKRSPENSRAGERKIATVSPHSVVSALEFFITDQFDYVIMQ